MTTRSLAVGALAAIGGALLWVAGPAHAETFVYDIPFDKPLSWSGVMLPWGAGGYLDWVIADGGHPGVAGKPGKALRISNTRRRQPAVNEIRTLMFNHEPDTPATIHLDLMPVVHPQGSQFMVRWYDGYVTAEAFEKSGDDPFEPFPGPIFVRGAPPREREWEGFEFVTPPLQHTILTIAFVISQPQDPNKDEPDEFIDYYLDNLRVTVTPLSHYMDPGFDWHGKGGGTMTEWRWTAGGAHLDWCDFMEETEVPWGDDQVLRYGFTSFHDTGSRQLHVKHNYAHDTANVRVGGSSTIGLVRRDPQDAPASWGIRQTVSYAAFDLKPDDDAHIEVTIKYTFQQDTDRARRARLQVGCDPRGGIVTEDALWSEEDSDINWDDGEWRYATLAFDRPPGATALTVYFRCRDGVVEKDGEVRATTGMGRAFADWMMVKATKR